MQYALRRLICLTPAASLLALGGCGLPPPMVAAPLAQAPAQADSAMLAGDGAQFPMERWWQTWGDPGLDALMDEAFKASPDMAVAAARVRAADALALQSGAALGPYAGVDASLGGTKQSENMGIPPLFVPKGVIDTGKLAVSLGLDLDLWGKNRAQLAAARGEAEAARADAAQARLMLASGVALAWGDLARIQASRRIAAATLEADTQIEALTGLRQRQGLDNQADLSLATARRAGAQRALAALDEAAALVRYRIAALLGAGPGRAESLPLPAPDLGRAVGVPDALAASLVARRPDIASARLRAEAQTQRVKAARAAFLPDINLAAVAGLQSLGVDQLLKGGSTFANFGPALSLPLFSGGQLQGQHQSALAGYDEAVARYNGVLIGAFHEVADALTQKRSTAVQLAQARAGAVAADNAARLTRLRYGKGLANLLQVLTAEDSARSAQQAVAELELRAYQSDVMLVKALGGGYAAPAPAGEKP
ncbi:efflux transporter outer membrane subunit [Novosphingobium sp. B 225]|uniref:efflux transporter outer membrane subunit n=1 Tax=Novosphingobium sp. B 225 TaxID=1961849 RepID=UPI000B4C1F73|nr:efflux transporter outer membrane subunit [Novosphingobium sp. B 225]